MKLRLVIAVFLLSVFASVGGCSSGSAVDRTSELQRVEQGYITKLSPEVTAAKGYEVALISNRQELDALSERTWERSRMFGGSKGFDPAVFKFDDFYYLAVISRPKSGSIKSQIKSAAQSSDGRLTINILETLPPVQTGDLQREIVFYQIAKSIGVNQVEVKGLETQNRAPTH